MNLDKDGKKAKHPTPFLEQSQADDVPHHHVGWIIPQVFLPPIYINNYINIYIYMWIICHTQPQEGCWFTWLILPSIKQNSQLVMQYSQITLLYICTYISVWLAKVSPNGLQPPIFHNDTVSYATPKGSHNFHHSPGFSMIIETVNSIMSEYSSILFNLII